MLWLAAHNPEIDWKKGEVKNNIELVKGSSQARDLDENLVYYVCKTKCGMMAAESKLTKQLLHDLFFY